MAVKLISIRQAFIGLSSDTKPITVPIGSRFFEIDTCVTYITYDGTNWVRFAIEEYRW